MKTIGRIIVGLLLVLIIGSVAAYLFRNTLTGKGGSLDDWIGRQIVGLVNTYLEPQIAFARLDYTAPGTVDLYDVTLASPDGVRVLELEHFGITLNEVPRLGQPIRVESVTIEKGQVNIIQTPEGRIRGFSPFVKASPDQAFRPKDSDKQFRLSDVLNLRKVRLIDARLRYEPPGGGQAMVLDGITTDLDITPQAAGNEPDWYTLALKLDRGDLFRLDVDGRLNVDTYTADVHAAKLHMDVTNKTIASLPPQVQTLLTDHEATGLLDVRLNGRVPLKSWRAAKLAFGVTLTDFSFAAGDYQLPIAKLTADATMDQQTVTLSGLHGETLDGTVALDGTMSIAENAETATLNWDVKRLDLAALLRARANAPTDQPDRIEGRLTTAGTMSAKLRDLPASLTGGGTAELREGRLMWIPMLSQMAKLMQINVGGLKLGGTPRDKADATFTFTSDGIRVDSFDAITTVLAASATGMIHYDQGLDLIAQAGPIQKVADLLGSVVGKVGDVIKTITGELVRYHITGTLSNPIVKLAVMKQELP